MTNKDALLKRIQKLAGDEKDGRVIIVDVEEHIPPHGPKDVVIIVGEKYRNL